jgi:hypothetical protein
MSTKPHFNASGWVLVGYNTDFDGHARRAGNFTAYARFDTIEAAREFKRRTPGAWFD